MEEYRKYEPIFGSWYLSRQIGKGSFGKVYEITREEFGSTYKAALKIISIPQDEDDIRTRLAAGTGVEEVSDYYRGILRDLINENEIMSRLKGNSNIVSYEDHQIIQHEDGIGYDILIRMELLTPLLDRLVHEKLGEREVVRLGIDMCKALELCHRKNIIHRDIKPQNIFITENGDYKLGDFGIARTIEKTADGMSRKGTFKYMAPEVFRGENYDHTVDLYSLGLVLYSLLNDFRGPFLPAPPARVTHADEEQARARRFSGEPLEDPRNAGSVLSMIIRKACAFYPQDRYRSAEQMRADLESYLANYDTEKAPYIVVEPWPGERPAAPETTPAANGGPREIPPQERPKRRLAVIAGIAGLAVILLALVLMLVLKTPDSGDGDKPGDGADGGEKQKTEQKKEETEPETPSHPDGAMEYNGHYYLVVNDPEYWTDARDACENMGGHLATITSQEEQEFVAGLIENSGTQKNYWLGGSDHDSEGDWVWITGEAWTYSNWRIKQPDNRNTEDTDHDQDYLQICCGSEDEDRYMMWWDVANSGISNGWEDYPNYKDTQFTGYVCEWEK